jgi:hypothetical protein
VCCQGEPDWDLRPKAKLVYSPHHFSHVTLPNRPCIHDTLSASFLRYDILRDAKFEAYFMIVGNTIDNGLLCGRCAASWYISVERAIDRNLV